MSDRINGLEREVSNLKTKAAVHDEKHSQIERRQSAIEDNLLTMTKNNIEMQAHIKQHQKDMEKQDNRIRSNTDRIKDGEDKTQGILDDRNKEYQARAFIQKNWHWLALLVAAITLPELKNLIGL